MSLFQPSFCVPRNQTIDVTNADDMIFSWKLNGNNMLCAYNIQVYDIDTNKLVYELASTENQRKIQEQINLLTGYISNQNNKLTQLDQYQNDYSLSTLKTEFKEDLENDRNKSITKFNSMSETLNKLKNGTTLTQSEITKYFEYWGDIRNIVRDRIGKIINTVSGEVISPEAGTAEYIRQQIIVWQDIDPDRKDGIDYIDKTNIINDVDFKNVKINFSTLSDYYENVISERIEFGASSLKYIDDITLDKAKKLIYLMYSKFTNEQYYNKDLYESVNQMWKQINISLKKEQCENVNTTYEKELSQQEYALAHMNGGMVKVQTKAYSITQEDDSYLSFIVPQDGEIAIINLETEVAEGWKYIIYNGKEAYIKNENIEYYNVATGKYYLENPVCPTDYKGNANLIKHQLPTDVLENGKSYKWSVTLYWSTSGKYNEEDKIDGSLTSVESYFDARKKPNVYLKNLKQLFTIPYNLVKIIKQTQFDYTDEDNELQTKNLNVGDIVLFIHLSEENENQSIVRCTLENGNQIEGIIPTNCLEDTGNYDPTKYKLYSKYATFIGGYEQEQYVSVSYFRWVLCKLQYDTEEVVEVVKDTGMIPSVDIKMYYDGFLNGEKYSIKLYVQTLDNVEVESLEYKFEVQYIDVSVQNMVNAENSPVEHGIIVEWSDLKLINGETTGETNFNKELPAEDHKSLTLNKGATLTFDKDKDEALNINWNANHIISMRIDEDRADNQTYYLASGLDDDGDVIYKKLELVNREDSMETGIADLVYTIHTMSEDKKYFQEIISSPLYWYIVILKPDGFSVYKKYANGLFPMQELYANINTLTGEKNITPIPLSYEDEPNKNVNYNYQTIIKKRWRIYK